MPNPFFADSARLLAIIGECFSLSQHTIQHGRTHAAAHARHLYITLMCDTWAGLYSTVYIAGQVGLKKNSRPHFEQLVKGYCRSNAAIKEKTQQAITHFNAYKAVTGPGGSTSRL